MWDASQGLESESWLHVISVLFCYRIRLFTLLIVKRSLKTGTVFTACVNLIGSVYHFGWSPGQCYEIDL